MAQPPTEPWNTRDQIQQHTLASSIINLHGTPSCVFDAPRLAELQHFTLSRSPATRDEFLQSHGWIDAPNTRPGATAAGQGSLTGLIIARYGTEDTALDERDWELLEGWFRRGMPVGERVER